MSAVFACILYCMVIAVTLIKAKALAVQDINAELMAVTCYTAMAVTSLVCSCMLLEIHCASLPAIHPACKCYFCNVISTNTPLSEHSRPLSRVPLLPSLPLTGACIYSTMLRHAIYCYPEGNFQPILSRYYSNPSQQNLCSGAACAEASLLVTWTSLESLGVDNTSLKATKHLANANGQMLSPFLYLTE